ncbi:potassium-transporting ATPase subunit KdpC [Paenibacillus pasadenensis]|uniref:potassium-transporting ATPase subunit KdpC n=1 Tax=Paenibacillus pasadenensis TaxID=217090 RepID=UPI00203EB8F3|nr:potassium-transporting ATPase subunit KdpC [Paenibacillus pasadenensis]MCM3747224.1 potassium-transporting ATPase subunit KdpC [Paenibacillus pasadenensis]
MKSIVMGSLRLGLVLMALCGVLYNAAVTGIAGAILPKQAEGSLIYDTKGRIVGSELIGQNFTDPQWFHGRISSIEYNGAGSGTPNYSPSNPDLLARVQQSIQDWRTNNPEVPVDRLPLDLITNSGSGLDPQISPAGAKAQIPRIRSLTGIPAEQLEKLVEEFTLPRQLGIFGEPGVHVLKLNLALQKLVQQ